MTTKQKRDFHNELPERHIQLVKSKITSTVGYAIVDEYNRYCVGWFGWKGNWGAFKDKVIFSSYERAEAQIAFMFLDSDLKIVKVSSSIREQVNTKIKQPKISSKRKEQLCKKYFVD